MPLSRFSEGQIIVVLKEQGVGVPIVDVRCRPGMISAIFHKWKARSSEPENERLNALLAESTPDNAMLEDGRAKNSECLIRNFAKSGVSEGAAPAHVSTRPPNIIGVGCGAGWSGRAEGFGSDTHKNKTLCAWAFHQNMIQSMRMLEARRQNDYRGRERDRIGPERG